MMKIRTMMMIMEILVKMIMIMEILVKMIMILKDNKYNKSRK